MVTEIINALRTWWRTRVQGDIALVLGSLAFVDLTPYSEDIKEFIPWPHWHAALRLLGGAAIWWRATQSRRQQRKQDDVHGDPDTPA